jgi:predicted nucleic acid-binding protein
MIASIALAQQLIVVTNNLSEYQRVPGLKVEDW